MSTVSSTSSSSSPAATALSTATSSNSTVNVTVLVSQLMAVEMQPIDNLNTKISTEQTQISTFGTISGLVSSLETAADSVQTSLQTPSATSSNSSALSATTDSTAVAGTYAVSVNNIASAQNLVSAGQASETTAIGNGTATTITFNFGTISGGSLSAGGIYTGANFTANGNASQSITIDSSDNTLQGISSAINAANIGVTATIVNDGSGTPYHLVLTSASGASNSLQITTSGGDGTINSLLAYDPTGTQNLTQTSAAQNASLTINGIPVTSPSNTVSGAIQGVTLSLTAPTTSAATLTVASNTSAINTAMSGFVSAYNALTTAINTDTSYGASSSSTASAGPLAGNTTLELMQNQLSQIMLTSIGSGSVSNLAQLGMSFQSDGTLTLDTTTLDSALSSNLSDVTNLFNSSAGLVSSLNTWANNVVDPGGLISSNTTQLNSSIQANQNQITELQYRMTILQTQYTEEYSNLNMMLSSLDSTSSYLTQQFTNTTK